MDDTAGHAQARDPREAKAVTLYRPVIVAGLYLLNIVLGFSVFIGLILAYVWRGEEETLAWEQTHYTYLVRTFWIGVAVWAATACLFAVSFGLVFGQGGGPEAVPPPGFFLTVFGAMIVWLLSAVWFFARSLLALVRAINCKPMPRPWTWLF